MNGRPFDKLRTNHERAALRQAQDERQKWYREITERPWAERGRY